MREVRRLKDSRLTWTFAAFALPAFWLLLSWGCAGTQPSRFYVLDPIPENWAEEQPVGIGDGVVIVLGPISIPEYLDRQEIMTRTGPNRLDLAEYDRWAEPLNANITSVLAQNLSVLLGTARVEIFPRPGSTKVKYQVVVDLNRFEGSNEGRVVLEGSWSILGGDKRAVMTTRRSNLVEMVDRPGYDGLVSAQGRVLGKLSREIASEMRSLIHSEGGGGR